MKQYTTPVIQWIFKYINPSTIEQIRVIIKDEANNMVEITDPEIHGNVVQVKLTQEQTASLKKGKVRMQLHWRLFDGTADASDEEVINHEDLLKGEEI